LIKNTILKNILTLSFGTALAQSINVLVSPLITRIYSPSDFGIFSIFISVVSILTIIINGRYELAILLPKKNEKAFLIFKLCLKICFYISFFILFLTLLFSNYFANILKVANSKSIIFLIPLSLFCAGFYQPLTYLLNRFKMYTAIAKTQLLQASSKGAFQILFGFFFNIKNGLVIGHLIGQILSLVYIKQTLKKEKPLNFSKKNRISSVAKSYKKFPLYSAPGGLLNTIANEMPLFFILNFFGSSVVGAYGLAIRILNIPLSLISNSMYQVLFREISALDRKNPDLLKKFITKNFFILFLSTLPLVFIIFFLGEPLFNFIFGKEWSLSGQFSSLLIFSVAIKFIIYPLDGVLSLERNVNKGFYWQFLYFITLITLLGFLSIKNISPIVFLKYLIIHDVILYTIHLFIIFFSVRRINQ
tara:strand:+ start:764 stop:2017 length:1254 start_codon:yes stop_codon:yes gene_type:complete